MLPRASRLDANNFCHMTLRKPRRPSHVPGGHDSAWTVVSTRLSGRLDNPMPCRNANSEGMMDEEMVVWC